MEKMTLLGDRVLVLPDPAEEVSKGGIIIPDTAKEKPRRGKVIYVGPGTKDDPTTLKPGDIILYGKYSGTDYSHEGIEYLIMRETDVMGILN